MTFIEKDMSTAKERFRERILNEMVLSDSETALRKEKELIKICQAWNEKEMISEIAIFKIWKLYEEENLKIWNENRKDPLNRLFIEEKESDQDE